MITTDNVGKTFTSALVTNVRVDNTNPTGSVTAPAASANVGGAAVTVSSNSADGGSGVANAQFQRSPAGGGVWTNIGAADTTSPYSVAWDTTAVADGLYDLRVVTTDNSGNTFTSALITNVRVDNTNPTGSVTAPAASANVRGAAVTVSSDSADGGSGVANALFQRSAAGAGVWTTIGAADTTSPYSVAWDTTALADGLYDLRVITTDNVGKTFTSAVVTNVRVDNTSPSGSITAPSAGANVTGNAVTVSSDSADGGSGVASAQFQRSAAGAGVWTTISTDNSSPYSIAWDTTAVADGLYDLRVITTDNAGNTFTSALVTNVRVDNTSPTGAVTAPAASANVRGAAVTVSSDSADGGSGVANAQFQRSPAGGGVWTNIGAADTTSPYSVAWDTTALADGLYDLRVVTTDNVGNTFTSALVANVRVDNTNPSGSITAPGAGANVTGSAVTVSSNSADGGSGVASALFQRSPAGAGVWTTIATDNSSPYSVAWDTTALADGNYDLRVITTDNAGNSLTSAVRTVTVDNSAPAAPALSFGSFTNASATGSTVYYRTGVAGGFTVTGTASDAQSGIDHLTFPALAAGWAGGGADTSSPYNGAYTFGAGAADPTEPNNVTATNNVAITSSPTSFTVTPDSLAPVSSILCDGASCAGSWYTSSVAISLSASDAGSGVQQIRYTTDGSDPSPINGNVYAVPFSLSAMTTVKFRSYDAVGNEEAVASQLVRVDTSAPSATMDNPGSPLTGTVTLTATASDVGSGLDTATFQYSYQGSGPWTTIGTDSTAPFSVNWDTTVENDGRYNLRVIVTDLAGNSTTSSVVNNRKVSNHPPIVNITSPGSYLNAGSPSPFTITTTTIASQFGVDNVEFFRCNNSSVNCSTGTFVSIGIDTTDPYTASWAQALEPEGNRALKAVITDNDATIGQDILNVIIDRTAPSGSITAPGAGAYVGGSAVAVSSDSADSLSGVDQVVFQRSPAGAGTWTAIATDTTAPYSVNWDTTPLSDGAYDLRAVTTDAAGNTFTSGIRTVNVDHTGPTATQDDPGANLSASVNLTGSASDPAGVTQVVFQRSPAGAGTWTPVGTDMSSPYSTSFDTTAVADGLYDLRVVATDSVGNTTNSALVSNRRVDNTVPTATQDDPGANLRATVTIAGSAADAGGSGIAQVVFQRSPAGAGTWTAIGTDTSAPYSTSFDTTAVADGLYDLRAVATDNAGNVTNSAPVANRRVDNTPPSATMNDPGADLGGTVSLTSATSDGGSGINTITYQYSLAGQNTWTSTPASWDTTLIGDGLYDLQVIATDNAGNSTTSAPVVNRRVDNGAPTVSITAPTLYINSDDPDPFTRHRRRAPTPTSAMSSSTPATTQARAARPATGSRSEPTGARPTACRGRSRAPTATGPCARSPPTLQPTPASLSSMSRSIGLRPAAGPSRMSTVTTRAARSRSRP